MKKKPSAPEHLAAPTPDAGAARAPLPRITEEDWKLIDYRIWQKLGKLAGFLALLATIIGGLGARAYINSLVTDKMESERKTFQADREKFEQVTQEVILRARLTAFLGSKYARDLIVFREVGAAAKEEITSGLPGKEKGREVLAKISRLEDYSVNPKEYPSFVHALMIDLNPSTAGPDKTAKASPKDDELTAQDWQEFERLRSQSQFSALLQLIQMYPHMRSFQRALDEAQESLVREDLKGGVDRIKLYEEYEKTPAAAYKKAWKEFKMGPFSGTASVGKFGFATLPAYGKDAFALEEFHMRPEGSPIY